MAEYDIKIINGKVLDPDRMKFIVKDLFINNGKLVSFDQVSNLHPKTTIDATGKAIVPGYIDSHVHIESSLVTPSELGKLLLKHGVTTIFADPHEIANVIGKAGIKYMITDSRKTPLDIFYMLPSSVPCVPFDHNGATLTANSLHEFYQYQEVKGLAEVMDYPAVASGENDIMAKIKDAKKHHLSVDGHTAGFNDQQLAVYEKAGIQTDHESTTSQEIKERLRHGFKIFLREGTVERDLKSTLPAMKGEDPVNFSFCTDDKLISDLVDEGSIDDNIQLALGAGVKPELVYTMATLNAAKAHQLRQVGKLQPGFKADLNILNDVNNPTPVQVIKNGQIVTENHSHPTPFTENTVHVQFKSNKLRLPLTTGKAHVLGIKPNHIDTKHLILNIPPTDNFQSDPSQDILKIVVVERHHNLGTVGVGLVQGFKIKHGAIATTIAHDDHNIVAVGTSDHDIEQAINNLITAGGGISVVNKQQTLSTLALPVAGLMSDKDYRTVAKETKQIYRDYKQIAAPIDFDPFITLSFLTLPVIPTLKMTDQGLYDFNQQQFINVNASSHM
ncbi:adenine deaminase [Fructilactobacillus fructivorans]|uniref:adenine deaminase n=1 Tax=Fructilactobacillus fructivorans TaxID=1614 RepID=UPI00070531CE|nr:adenine deaminase [Fructilactobacillus fructivorans]KRN40605.1 adenine deaminase [Fructilactobacillus fructivorans]KRN43146.1 adenine deaminase [Fructilactobacillus fructivorans]